MVCSLCAGYLKYLLNGALQWLSGLKYLLNGHGIFTKSNNVTKQVSCKYKHFHIPKS